MFELFSYYFEFTRKLNKCFEGKGGSLCFVEVNVEDMFFEDNEFDMIINVYFFYEFLCVVCMTVVKEMARVLKSGGKFFFVDSV